MAPQRPVRNQLRRTEEALAAAVERLGGSARPTLAMETPRTQKPGRWAAVRRSRRHPRRTSHASHGEARGTARAGPPRAPRLREMARTLGTANRAATRASLQTASAEGRSADRRAASPPGPLDPPWRHALKRTGMPLQFRCGRWHRSPMAGTIRAHAPVDTKPVSGRGEPRGCLTNLGSEASACGVVWGQCDTREYITLHIFFK